MTAARVRQRRPRTPGVVRPHRPRVQLSDEELVDLMGRAAAAGLGLSEFLVMRGLANDAVSASLSEVLTELLGLRRLLAGAANNLNQVARVANSTGVVPRAQLEAELEWLRRMAGPGGRLDEAIDRFRGPAARKGSRSA